MAKLSWCCCTAVLAAWVMIGCSGGDDDTIPPLDNLDDPTDTDVVFSKWQSLAEAPANELDFEQAMQYATALAEAHELDRFLQVLGDSEASPKAKVLAVVSLSPFLSHEMVERVVALTQPAHDTTTRASATKLLGTMLLPQMKPPAVEGMITPPTEEDLAQVRTRLRELAADDEHKVRFTAATLLARTMDEGALDQLLTLWNDEATDANERMELVYSLPPESGGTFTEIFKQAAKDPALDPEVRQRAVMELGFTNDPAILDLLVEVSESDPDPSVRAQAKVTVEGMRAHIRNAEPDSAETPEQPAPATGEG
ncbi:MAG: HEAT repeat domain-containing protein [Candidatus Hydrogenedentota bacterium]